MPDALRWLDQLRLAVNQPENVAFWTSTHAATAPQALHRVNQRVQRGGLEHARLGRFLECHPAADICSLAQPEIKHPDDQERQARRRRSADFWNMSLTTAVMPAWLNSIAWLSQPRRRLLLWRRTKQSLAGRFVTARAFELRHPADVVSRHLELTTQTDRISSEAVKLPNCICSLSLSYRFVADCAEYRIAIGRHGDGGFAGECMAGRAVTAIGDRFLAVSTAGARATACETGWRRRNAPRWRGAFRSLPDAAATRRSSRSHSARH